MMRPVLRPDARVLLTLHWDLDGDLRAVLLVLLGAVLFWNLLAVRHSVGLAVLLGNIVALGDGLVVALLLGDALTLLPIVVGRLALLTIGGSAFLLLLIGTLLLVGRFTVLLLLVFTLLPGGGLAGVLVESLADLFAGVFTSLHVVVAALATVVEEEGWVGNSGSLRISLSLYEAAGNSKAHEKECLEIKC